MPDPAPRPRSRQTALPGTCVLVGKDGPQLIRSSGRRWSDAAEARFLDHLAATCNVTASADAAGFTRVAIYKRRRRDAAFAGRWQAALDQGYARIEALVLRRIEEALEGAVPDPGLAIPPLTMKDALAVLGHHRRTVDRGPRSRRQWARPRSLDEVRDSILAKLEAFAPLPPLPLARGVGGGPATSPDERDPAVRELTPNPSRKREGEPG